VDPVPGEIDEPLLRLDLRDRVVAALEGRDGGDPGGVARVELRSKVRPDEGPKSGDALRVLIGCLGGVVTGDAAEHVLGTEERQQRLGSRGVGVGVPAVAEPVGEVDVEVLVSRYDQCLTVILEKSMNFNIG
jgi:hypothetical protein